jgi:hypothetical protein
VSGNWDKKIATATDQHRRDAFIHGLQTFTNYNTIIAPSTTAAGDAATPAPLAVLPIANDSPLTSEYDLFTKQPSRGFNTLTGLASLVRRPYSCHIICRCVCRLISVYHWK